MKSVRLQLHVKYASHTGLGNKQSHSCLIQCPIIHTKRLGVDLFDCNGKSHIVVTDYFSNYPEVATLQVTSSQAVIAFLKTVFARHGVPCEVFSDNGPQFAVGSLMPLLKSGDFNTHIKPKLP